MRRHNSMMSVLSGLLAVQGKANQKKSDGDAATWLPSNKSFRCEYVARQIGVKHKYSLWITQAEKGAISKVLSSCPTYRARLHGSQGFYSREDHRIRADRTADRTAS